MEPRGTGRTCPHCGWEEGASQSSPAFLNTRTVLDGRYLIGRVLGAGGFGITYLAWDLDLDMKLAIKEYFPNSFGARDRNHSTVIPANTHSKDAFEHGLKKFLEEGKALARFQGHPSIASVMAFFRENGTSYLVMKYEDGITLGGYLKQHGGRLDFSTVVRIAMPIFDALRAVHQEGILHRDISPDNIIINRSRQIKILDFGSAKRDMTTKDSALQITLKRGFSPEEQYRAKGRQGPWTDVYAVGATLYQCLTGSKPPDALERLGDDTLAAPGAVGVKMPKDAEKALLKALAVRASDRFQTVDGFRSALIGGHSAEEARDDLRLAPPPLPTPPSPRGDAPWRFAFVPIRLLAWFRRILGFDRSSPSISKPETGSSVQTKTLLHSELTTPDVSTQSAEDVGSSATHPGDSTVCFSNLPALRSTDAFLTIVESPDPRLRGRKVPVTTFPFRLGRSDADLSFSEDEGVSRIHAELDFISGSYMIRDTGSTNGTSVNGKRLKRGIAERIPFEATIQLTSTTRLRFGSETGEEFSDFTGLTVAGFLLERMLHRSSSSATYKALDTNLNRRIVLKILSPPLAVYPGYVEQFKNEAKMAAGLSHPYICKVIGLGETSIITREGRHDTLLYLCMDYMHGGSLADRLARNKTIPAKLAISGLRCIAAALDHAHRSGIVHGGLKPTSVVFDQEDHAYLTDFAFASRTGDENSWAVMGAPAFLAPEQLDGEPPTPKSDQYSFAVLAYLLLTGSRPFDDQQDPDERARNFMRGPRRADKEAERNGNERFSPSASDVLEKALSVEPAKRYESVDRFIEALDSALGSGRHRPHGECSVFMSYQRDSSSGWATHFAETLKEKHGIEAFVDTQGVDSAGPFPDRIRKAIEECDVFVCFLDAHTLESDWVKQEILFAYQCRKPMIPIIQERYTRPDIAKDTPEHITALIDCDGLPLLDRRNIHVGHTISDLAAMIKRTVLDSQSRV
jgi:serine/threonine protein kinase